MGQVLVKITPSEALADRLSSYLRDVHATLPSADNVDDRKLLGWNAHSDHAALTGSITAPATSWSRPLFGNEFIGDGAATMEPGRSLDLEYSLHAAREKIQTALQAARAVQQDILTQAQAQVQGARLPPFGSQTAFNASGSSTTAAAVGMGELSSSVSVLRDTMRQLDDVTHHLYRKFDHSSSVVNAAHSGGVNPWAASSGSQSAFNFNFDAGRTPPAATGAFTGSGGYHAASQSKSPRHRPVSPSAGVRFAEPTAGTGADVQSPKRARVAHSHARTGSSSPLSRHGRDIPIQWSLDGQPATAHPHHGKRTHLQQEAEEAQRQSRAHLRNAERSTRARSKSPVRTPSADGGIAPPAFPYGSQQPTVFASNPFGSVASPSGRRSAQPLFTPAPAPAFTAPPGPFGTSVLDQPSSYVHPFSGPSFGYGTVPASSFQSGVGGNRGRSPPCLLYTSPSPRD